MNSIMKKSSFFLLATLMFIVGCSSGKQQNTPRTYNGPIRSTSDLKFIADIPSLKEVSLKMSESKFLKILLKQNLFYQQGKMADETAYYVEPQAHVLVIFMFRQGKCTDVQRLSN